VGSVGRAVVAHLAARGHRVRVFDLPGCDYSSLQDLPQAQIISGDIRDLATVQQAARGVDALIHLAALLPPGSERDRSATTAVNVQGTANVIAALREGSPGAHLVFSSSVCVYGDTTAATPPIRTSFPLHAVDLYAESKIEAERLVAASELNHTVLRVSGISVPAFLAPPQTWPFRAEQRLEFVCHTDVVAALAACVELEGTSRQTYNVAGGATWRMRGREYVARFNELMGLPPEEARYSDRPGYFDWYDTHDAQATLNYQRTSYDRYLELLDQAIEAAFAE
jgi:nucleoside-diphosphate-sugar epimerase